MKPLAIDLFCGLFGFGEVAAQEGYDVIGFDLEDMAGHFGMKRAPGCSLVIQDILTLHGSQFRDAAFIWASPPCQFFSYTAMPWSRAKALAAEVRADPARLEKELALFNACFGIQREACEAAGRHIPMVVENVRGAIPWVGRSKWNFGSFHLWGDVPALMPSALRAAKMPGHSMSLGAPKWNTHHSESVQAIGLGCKHHGDWFRDPDCPSRQGGQVREGRKGAGAGAEWFDGNLCVKSSNSPARKLASAQIAKIPPALASHVARVFKP